MSKEDSGRGGDLDRSLAQKLNIKSTHAYSTPIKTSFKREIIENIQWDKNKRSFVESNRVQLRQGPDHPVSSNRDMRTDQRDMGTGKGTTVTSQKYKPARKESGNKYATKSLKAVAKGELK